MKLMEKIQSGVYTIAEMSANHAGSLENALRIVRAAKSAGADCLKIKTYTAGPLTLKSDRACFTIKDGPWAGETLYNLYKRAYTPWEWQAEIKAECDRQHMDFLSSPFDASAVDFLEKLGADAYKIASFELVDIPLIRYVAGKGKPVIISTGMGSIEEIAEAVEACGAQGNNAVILLKCTSEYPAQFGDMNLRTIEDMGRRFGVPIGLSDHSPGSTAAVAAVALGARVIEKHFCLSREIENADSVFSMEPAEFAQMVANVNDAYAARGSVHFGCAPKEASSKKLRRSLFVARDIAKGSVIVDGDVRSVRPADGLPPKHIDRVTGMRAARDLEFGEPLEWDMLED
jgi:pseudaminic acid synthase